MEKRITRSAIQSFCVFLCLLLTAHLSQAQDKPDYTKNWPEWRGLYNTGATSEGNVPVEFSETKNVKWKVGIPGKGHATPIVWENQIIVQTAVATDKKGEIADASAPASQMAPNQTDLIHQFKVISVDKTTGKIIWQTVVKEEMPVERTHELSSWASNSPVTDGENIYAFFGSRGLFCLDMKGNVIWERDFGQMDIVASFGEGSSPAVYKDKVFVQWDHQGKSFLYALDKKTGKEAWTAEREEITSWATPLVVEVEGKAQLITSATNKVRSYDAENGTIIWECTGMTRNVIPNPMYADGILYLMSGFRGNAIKAVDLAKAKGDITGTSAILWEYNQDASYTPSPVLMDGNIYFLKGNNGIMTCLNAKDGKVVYSNQKVDGINTIFSSPTGNKDKIYIAATGIVDVIKAGNEFALLSKNTLDDTFHASPVIVGNDLFLRGFKYLYCISEK
ncbi:MAG TPA: PQQ-binding-like beta-propeller repeat protein [Prolixibacteraceae bacterium]|nr:PQQ-binding-like beta-propeller repeat protein [Prolixibacteraceae bacterium]